MYNRAENVTDYRYYIDLHKDINITIDASTNQSGFIYIDDNGNNIGSDRNGLQAIKACTTFTPTKTMLFYNEREYERIDSTFSDYDKPITIPKVGYLKYKFGYDIIELDDDNLSGYKFTTDLTTQKPFKIWCNNKLVSDYLEEFDGITLQNIDRYLLNENKSNTMKIIAYDRNQVVEEVVLTYNGCDEIDTEALEGCDYSQFDDSIRIVTFDSFSTSQNKTLYSYKSNYGIQTKDILEDVANTLTIQLYDRYQDLDLRSYINSNRFRVVGVSPVDKKIVTYTNCKLSTGVNTTVQMQPNIKSYIIDYEERIEKTFYDETGYGEGGYGEGFYGGSYKYNDLRGDGSGSDRT